MMSMKKREEERREKKKEIIIPHTTQPQIIIMGEEAHGVDFRGEVQVEGEVQILGKFKNSELIRKQNSILTKIKLSEK